MRKKGHNIFIRNNQSEIEITNEIKQLTVNAIVTALEYESFTDKAEVSVTFCDDLEIKTLNNEYRNKNKVTDVLSFPMFDDEENGGYVCLGDIVIDLQQAKRQAKEYGHSFEREVGFLCVHSILHLLGYDHEEGKAQESEMFEKQKEILKLMGLER